MHGCILLYLYYYIPYDPIIFNNTIVNYVNIRTTNHSNSNSNSNSTITIILILVILVVVAVRRMIEKAMH
jgi:hypothetical protein